MRWILLLIGLGAFALAFSTKSSGFLAFCLVVGSVAMIAALFAFAAAKIEATSRPDTTLLTDKDISAIRASLRKAQKPPEPPPSSNSEQ